MTTDRRCYELRVDGHLDERWASWFGELVIARHDDGTCTLTGPIADQAQLHGVLARLRDIGATLLSLRALGDDGSAGGQQSELASAPDGGPAVVDAELRVDALGVRAQRVDRDEQVRCDLGAVELGVEQMQHLELARAERLDDSLRP